MKKLMVLGGNFLQMQAIKRAKELGYYVISVDYLPDNPGHRFSDEYHNVSTVDKEAVLALARELEIDGILAYATDVAAPTAAYVSEKLGLPTNPYESVMILTHKDSFRAFMAENGLLMPWGAAFCDKEAAREYFDSHPLPVMIKPVDSSGSKGVTKVTSRTQFDAAFEYALQYSIEKRVIVEQFIERHGYQIDGDGFIMDGRIAFFGVMDQHNNHARNPYAPIGHSWPSIQDEKYKSKAFELISSIFKKLNMRFGAFNFEYIIGGDDNVYLLEIGPRNGGNLISEALKCACGADLTEASIKACVGDDYAEALRPKFSRPAASYVIHSLESGRYKGLEIDDAVKDKIVLTSVFAENGEEINAFRNASDSIGALVLEFSSVDEMNRLLDNMWEHIKVVVE